MIEKNIIENIKNEKLIQKYLYNNTWLSGSSTKVFPISIFEESKEIIIQLKTTKNVFKKLLEKYQKNDNIKYCYFWKSDGSCPCTLNFIMK